MSVPNNEHATMIFFLIGYMGCGKSTAARLIARRFGMKLIDLDRYIEQSEACSITEIFERDSHDGFREIEARCLRQIVADYSDNVSACNHSELQDVVVATGGGTPCFHDNMSLMIEVGYTIYLSSSPSRLANRLAKAKTGRPLLENLDNSQLLDFITSELEWREPFYQKSAITVHNVERNAELLLENISKIKFFDEKTTN